MRVPFLPGAGRRARVPFLTHLPRAGALASLALPRRVPRAVSLSRHPLLVPGPCGSERGACSRVPTFPASSSPPRPPRPAGTGGEREDEPALPGWRPSPLPTSVLQVSPSRGRKLSLLLLLVLLLDWGLHLLQ